MKQLVTIEARPNASKTKSTYYLSWRADGKRIRKSLRHSDPYLAEKQRRQKEIELGTYVPVKTGGEKKLLSEAVMLYLMANRKLRPSTRSLTLRSFDFLVLSAGDIPIGRFDYAAAEQFQAWCIETGRNGTTANIYTKSIRPVFTWAIKQKWIYSDPFSELTLFKRSKKRIRLYEPDEFTAMLSKCPDDLWRARLLAAKTAGLRRGEVLNLTRDDIDFRGGVIHLQEKLETPCTWLWEVKDKDRREVPLVEQLEVLLKRIIRNLPADQQYVMLSTKRFEQITKLRRTGQFNDRMRIVPDDDFCEPFRKIQSDAKVSYGTFHDLRKTCITEWLESGLQPHEVMELAGHGDIKTTMNYYVATRKSLLNKARFASAKTLQIVA